MAAPLRRIVETTEDVPNCLNSAERGLFEQE
jgi:hypothetical protein